MADIGIIQAHELTLNVAQKTTQAQGHHSLLHAHGIDARERGKSRT